jgi:predicted transcriptional regulator
MKYIIYLALLATSSVQSLSSIMPTRYLDERRNNQDFNKIEQMHEEEMKIRNKLFRNKVRNAHYSHVK